VSYPERVIQGSIEGLEDDGEVRGLSSGRQETQSSRPGNRLRPAVDAGLGANSAPLARQQS
jgi:hypothetical protein